MESYQYALNVIIGMVIIPFVTQGIKTWLKVENPLLKLSVVIILSALAGIGLAKVYVPEMTVGVAITSALTIALAAIGGKVTHKTFKQLKGA